jgi:acyl-CoA reductase-like NAD-dependent aldehyde dehydrogenase
VVTKAGGPANCGGDERHRFFGIVRLTVTTQIKDILAGQRKFIATGATLSIGFRLTQLKKLKEVLQRSEAKLFAALKADMKKPEFESYGSELGFIYEEINHAVSHLKKWARPRRVKTPMMHWPSRSYVFSQPKGVVLIIGPWNYPMQLVFSPLVGALAAGNCVVIKPSEIATNSEAFISELITKTFAKDYCAVVTGGLEETKEILAEKFNHIFFTGSTIVGRLVMLAAAESLTPVTLELGGKSPCIVDDVKELRIAARRIVWGKFYNAGQTCVSPDYLLVKRGLKDKLMAQIGAAITDFFGEDPSKSPDFGRIIDDRHFDRLSGLMHGARIVFGGKTDKSSRYIAPTVVDAVTLESPCMVDEIFGPILPVFEYGSQDEVFDFIAKRPNPLSCYVFSDDPQFINRVIEQVPYGGGCVNNTLIHLAVPELPFGGIGSSGIGAYHGKKSFEVFSHQKAIVRTPWFADLWLKYPPYAGRLKLLKLLIR